MTDNTAITGRALRVKEAAAATSRSEKTIRRALDAGELAYVEGAWNGGRAGAPGRVRWIQEDELRAWHSAHGGKSWRELGGDVTMDAMSASIRRLTERLAAVEAMMGRGLPARSGPSSRSGPDAQDGYLGDVAAGFPAPRSPSASTPLTRPWTPLPAHSTGAANSRRRPINPHTRPLPDGLVSLQSYSLAHGARESQQTTFKKNPHLGIMSPELGINWLIPGSRNVTRNALDQAGRLRFHQIWSGAYGRPKADWWRDAPDCELCSGHGQHGQENSLAEMVLSGAGGDSWTPDSETGAM